MPTVRTIDAFPLFVPLLDPFVIANARLDTVRNVAVRVRLADGTEGWGEIGTLPPITAESYEDAVGAVSAAAEWLPGTDAADRAGIAERAREAFPKWGAVRCGIEQACAEATARSLGVPLHQMFGQAGGEVVTDITVPIVDPVRAAELGALWRSRGFATIKLKVGGDLGADLRRMEAVWSTHPDVGLVLDANEGWSVEETLEAVALARSRGKRIVLLEQPVPRADLDGLARLTRESGVPVAADEACKSADDVERIGRERLASVINVKIAKCGVHEAVRMFDAARRHGLDLMIGAMVETRIGTGFSAHAVKGIGNFLVVDLDTPWLMTEDPVAGGPILEGPVWRIDDAVPGVGARPADAD